MQGKNGDFCPLAPHLLNLPLNMAKDPQFNGEGFDFINLIVETLNCQCWYGNDNNDSNNGNNNVLNDHQKMKILIFSYRWIILK